MPARKTRHAAPGLLTGDKRTPRSLRNTLHRAHWSRSLVGQQGTECATGRLAGCLVDGATAGRVARLQSAPRLFIRDPLCFVTTPAHPATNSSCSPSLSSTPAYTSSPSGSGSLRPVGPRIPLHRLAHLAVPHLPKALLGTVLSAKPPPPLSTPPTPKPIATMPSLADVEDWIESQWPAGLVRVLGCSEAHTDAKLMSVSPCRAARDASASD